MITETPLDIFRTASPALIIVGRNGAGKSTLINSIFGRKVAEVGTRSDVTVGVAKYTLPTGIEIYDTPGAGGLSEHAESAMRSFLQIDTPHEQRHLIPADMIIFVFTYERFIPQEFEFFRDVDAVYKDRIIVVKNFKEDESDIDFQSNNREIQTRIGRNPICVDAENGKNVDELIREIFRFLTPDKLRSFNLSLENRKRRARDLSRSYTAKAASLAAVSRSQSGVNVREKIEQNKKELTKQIMEAYLDQAVDDNLMEGVKNDPAYTVLEDNIAARGASATLGGGLGMLIGLIGGPIGMALGGLFGSLFGAAVAPRLSRGGSPAVANIIAQGYGLCEIIDESFNEPILLLTQSEDQMKRWLEENRRQILGTLKDATVITDFAIKEAALIQYLNNPNTLDPSVVELRLRPVVEAVFDQESVF